MCLSVCLVFSFNSSKSSKPTRLKYFIEDSPWQKKFLSFEASFSEASVSGSSVSGACVPGSSVPWSSVTGACVSRVSVS